jgi:serine protease Do
MVMSWRSGALGIEAESLKTQLAEYFGVKEGVLVRQVSKGSAAEKAGIKAGDVITKVDNEKVSTPGKVTGAFRSALPKKKTIPVTVVRNRQETTLNVTIEEQERLEPSPRPRTIRAPRPPTPPAPPARRVRAPESIPL